MKHSNFNTKRNNISSLRTTSSGQQITSNCLIQEQTFHLRHFSVHLCGVRRAGLHLESLSWGLTSFQRLWNAVSFDWSLFQQEEQWFKLLYIPLLCLFGWMYHWGHVEVRRHFMGLSSLALTCGVWEFNTSHQSDSKHLSMLNHLICLWYDFFYSHHRELHDRS